MRWLLAHAVRKWSWGAFDRANDKRILTKIPFCDFGEALDPPSVDVTSHVLEAFAKIGMPRDHSAIKNALRYIWSEQESDGPWFGRWGVNYIYGTSAVIPALAATSVSIWPTLASTRHAIGSWNANKSAADGAKAVPLHAAGVGRTRRRDRLLERLGP